MSTGFVSYKPRLREDGLLVSRQLKPHQMGEVLRTLIGNIARLIALSPPWATPPWEEIRAEAELVYELLLTEIGPIHAPTIQVPTELKEMLALLQREVDLTDRNEVNRFLDRLINALANIIHSYANDVAPNDYTAAANRLEGLWFADGRAFLRQTSRRQWFETQRRFARPSPQTKADLLLLHQKQAHERILAFNDWFARLLGIDPDQPIPEDLLEGEEEGAPNNGEPALSQAQIEARIDALFNRLLCHANAVWPSPSDSAHATARRLALGTLLEKIGERP
jgi:hypothetical protein